jgi:hypothetical protein
VCVPLPALVVLIAAPPGEAATAKVLVEKLASFATK